MRWGVVTVLALGCRARSEPPPPAAVEVTCDGGRVDLATDPSHCGFCGHPCQAGHGKTSCVARACVPVCEPGWVACVAAEGCVHPIASDPRACGGCGTTCVGGPCVDGACRPPAAAVPSAGGFTALLTGDGEYVYATALAMGETERVHRLRLADDKVEPAFDGFLPVVSLDGGFLGWRRDTFAGPVRLVRRTKAGEETVLAKDIQVVGRDVVWPLAVEGGTAVFFRSESLVALDLATTKERTLASVPAPLAVVAFEGRAIYQSANPEGLWSIALTGGLATALPAAPGRLVGVDGGSLWFLREDGLYRTALDGTTPTLRLVPHRRADGTISHLISILVHRGEAHWIVRSGHPFTHAWFHARL